MNGIQQASTDYYVKNQWLSPKKARGRLLHFNRKCRLTFGGVQSGYRRWSVAGERNFFEAWIVCFIPHYNSCCHRLSILDVLLGEAVVYCHHSAAWNNWSTANIAVNGWSACILTSFLLCR